jgi:hypothetical protein
MSQATPRTSLRHKNADLHGSAPDKSETALDVSPALLKEIEHFFISYNQERGKKIPATRAT